MASNTPQPASQPKGSLEKRREIFELSQLNDLHVDASELVLVQRGLGELRDASVAPLLLTNMGELARMTDQQARNAVGVMVMQEITKIGLALNLDGAKSLSNAQVRELAECWMRDRTMNALFVGALPEFRRRVLAGRYLKVFGRLDGPSLSTALKEFLADLTREANRREDEVRQQREREAFSRVPTPEERAKIRGIVQQFLRESDAAAATRLTSTEGEDAEQNRLKAEFLERVEALSPELLRDYQNRFEEYHPAITGELRYQMLSYLEHRIYQLKAQPAA